MSPAPAPPDPMNRFRDLVHEIHRRSLWQVLAIYGVASWVALEVAGYLTENFGLPDWFPAFALALLVKGSRRVRPK